MNYADDINRAGTCCFCGLPLGWYATKQVERGGQNRICCFWGYKSYNPKNSGCAGADLASDARRDHFEHYSDG